MTGLRLWSSKRRMTTAFPATNPGGMWPSPKHPRVKASARRGQSTSRHAKRNAISCRSFWGLRTKSRHSLRERGSVATSTETQQANPPAQPHLKRVLGLWDLIYYGVILTSPIAAVPLFGEAQVLSHGHA